MLDNTVNKRIDFSPLQFTNFEAHKAKHFKLFAVGFVLPTLLCVNYEIGNILFGNQSVLTYSLQYVLFICIALLLCLRFQRSPRTSPILAGRLQVEVFLAVLGSFLYVAGSIYVGSLDGKFDRWISVFFRSQNLLTHSVFNLLAGIVLVLPALRILLLVSNGQNPISGFYSYTSVLVGATLGIYFIFAQDFIKVSKFLPIGYTSIIFALIYLLGGLRQEKRRSLAFGAILCLVAAHFLLGLNSLHSVLSEVKLEASNLEKWSRCGVDFHEKVRQRAYTISRSKEPNQRPEEIWFEAERQLIYEAECAR